MIEAHKIGQELGFKTIGLSYRELENKVAHGLSKAAAGRLLDSVFDEVRDRNNYLYSIIPEGTYKGRKKLLTEAESEKITRVARIVATAKDVWGDDGDAKEFLTTRHKALDNNSPMDSARSELGAIQVEDLLWKIYYGLPV